MPHAFRVLVTGSRTWTDTAAMAAALAELYDRHGDRLTVVHGACPRGADAIADGWCRRHRVRVERHPADWSTGRAAGHARNAAMVATGPDLCLAFIRDRSPGATGCANLAEQAGIPTVRHIQSGSRGGGGVSVPPVPAVPAQVRPGTGSWPVRIDPYHPDRITLLTAARGYAARGWPVFMLGRTKRPVANCERCRTERHDAERCACLTCHGFYAASTDPDRIAAIIAAVPGGRLAIRTGAASGVVVVDVDPAHGGRDSLARLIAAGLAPPTATVVTGSSGWHLYYWHPGGPVPSRPLAGYPGIDIKADGGYVVAPPSVHPVTGRPYRWAGQRRPVQEMPPALVAACLTTPAPPPGPAAAAAPVAVREAGGISHPDRLLAAHLAAVHRAPVGRRRTTLYGAARGVARMVAAGALTPADALTALTEVGRQAEQSEREIRAAIAGGFADEGVAA